VSDSPNLRNFDSLDENAALGKNMGFDKVLQFANQFFTSDADLFNAQVRLAFSLFFIFGLH